MHRPDAELGVKIIFAGKKPKSLEIGFVWTCINHFFCWMGYNSSLPNCVSGENSLCRFMIRFLTNTRSVLKHGTMFVSEFTKNNLLYMGRSCRGWLCCSTNNYIQEFGFSVIGITAVIHKHEVSKSVSLGNLRPSLVLWPRPGLWLGAVKRCWCGWFWPRLTKVVAGGTPLISKQKKKNRKRLFTY